MHFCSNKEIGNSSLGIAIEYFCSNSYIVSIPLNDTQDYDLIVEKNNEISRVQVKGTKFKTKYGFYQVSLKSCGGTRGVTYKTIIDTNVELVFIVTKEKNLYLIPKSLIKNRAAINLGSKYNKYLL